MNVKKQSKRLRGKNRTNAIIGIVQTDNTFNRAEVQGTNYWVGRCIHCNTSIVVSLDGETNATVEHIVPLIGGGEVNDVRNLALACERCNNQKGIKHDRNVHKNNAQGARANEVVQALLLKRIERWRDAE